MKKTKTILMLMLSSVLLLQGCMQVGDPPSATGDPAVHSYYATAEYHYQTDLSGSLASILTGLSPDYLRLVNKTHPIPRNDAPASRVRIPTSLTNYQKTVELESRTATALLAMLEEMAANGIYPKVTSGYRDYAYQESLFYQYLQNERSTISADACAFLGEDYIRENYTNRGLTALNDADARRVVLSYSAYPGTSEHQTGLCVDFVAADGSPLDLSFENSAAFRWLSQNAYKFGFILRFPADKTAITGYSYEPWHYRFVGREAATDIFFNHLTLEEYLEKTN